MSGIEKILGSVNLVVLLIFTISMITISNFFIAYGVYKIFGSTSSYYNCNDGQAPIIFALSVINCKLDQLNLTRSIFGLVNVPKLAFPFILYICFIIVTPMGTFTFLTSGMLYGYCFVFARLEFLFFSVKNLERIESKLCCIIKSKNFITHQNALFYKGETILPDFLSQKSLNSDSDKNSLIEGDFIQTVQDADSLLNGFQELDENEQWK
ncbi:rhomboid-like protein [Anaeramoeba flamelloides]|uniref:Rhomboid-like protein n=1 Tax=Anaeramoeba flamelloides TaxID=1746091 RepID=A0AAV7YX51_9EUKA|nr:rhomboid-like protein [Anaeramoeba flamelloides]